jgi:hypothetical protein
MSVDRIDPDRSVVDHRVVLQGVRGPDVDVTDGPARATAGNFTPSPTFVALAAHAVANAVAQINAGVT